MIAAAARVRFTRPVTARAADVGALVRAARTPLADLALVATVVAAVTLVLYPVRELDPGVSSGVLYVLGVLLLAIYRGLWIGLVASVASAIALDFFHAEPAGRFDAKSAGDFVAIGVLLLTATSRASSPTGHARGSSCARCRRRGRA